MSQSGNWWSALLRIVGAERQDPAPGQPPTLPTLNFSPEQGQSAAKIEGPNTAVLEQWLELGMKEREMSRWAKKLGGTKVGIVERALEGLSPGDSRFFPCC